MVAEKKAKLNKIEVEILSSIENRPKNAARLLLDSTTMELILLFGVYRRFSYLAKVLSQCLNYRNAADRILSARIGIFIGEMALYLDDESSAYSLVESSLSTMQRSKQLPQILKSRSRMIFGRLAGRLGRSKIEQKNLEDGLPLNVSNDSKEMHEWYFRMLAFYKKNKQFDNFMLLVNEVGDISSIKDEIVKSNILSEIGRVCLLEGAATAAQGAFQAVMDISMRHFHRRGILITALFAAKCSMAINQYEDAARYLLTADQFKDGASRKKEIEEIEVLRFELEKSAGINIFCALKKT
jgi:hypothetical protein